MDQETNEIGQPSNSRPRLPDWVWRPWYARLWWTFAAVFWIVAALDSLVFHLVPIDRTNTDLIYLLVVLFHPFVIVPVLSFGFVRAWTRFIARKEQAGEDVSRIFDGSNGFYPDRLDPTDPLDPRFIAHPANPMSPTWRDRHLWGRD